MSKKYKYCSDTKFISFIEQAGRRHGRSEVFSDFLTIVVCCLSAQEQEELYLKTIKKYSKEELNDIAAAFACLVDEMENNGEGLKDCLGDYYMEVLASARQGQFFTPQEACDMMALLVNPASFTPINDPCCGSGRFFLASAKVNRLIYCFGEDIDYQCCQMTLINLCLNGIYGIITHQNSLSDANVWHRWEIKPHPVHKIPYIYEINLNPKESEAEEVKPTEEQLTPEAEPEEIKVVIQDKKLNEFLTQLDLL